MGVFHAQERFSSFEIAFAYEQASSARLALPRYCEKCGSCVQKQHGNNEAVFVTIAGIR